LEKLSGAVGDLEVLAAKAAEKLTSFAGAGAAPPTLLVKIRAHLGSLTGRRCLAYCVKSDARLPVWKGKLTAVPPFNKCGSQCCTPPELDGIIRRDSLVVTS
jgi:hypothetical protein